MILLGVISISYCFKKTPKKSPEETLPYKETFEYKLKVGDKFDISLPDNPSTGSSWQMLVNKPLEKMSYELSKVEYKPDKPVLEGSGGITTFTFTAKKPVKYDSIYLYYGHIWSG